MMSAPSFAQGRYIVVESTGNEYSNPWDDQFYVYFPDYTVSAGDVWEWSMEVKAYEETTTNSYMCFPPGTFLSTGGFGSTFPFTTEWKTVNGVYECVAADEGGQSVAFNLSVLSDANKYYFRNISVKVNGNEIVKNGDLSSNDFSSFYWRTYGGDPELVTTDMVFDVDNEPIPYAIFDESTGTLTFYYDKNKPDGAYGMRTSFADQWYDVALEITKVVFDKSFADYRPTSCVCWFVLCDKLTEIQGMKEYLNTENVTNMSGMFSACSQIETLDLSNFNTEKVTNMDYMFANCENLTTLDLSYFSTKNVTNMEKMFYNSENLQTIFVGDNWTTSAVTSSEDMFGNCEKICGGKGTSYNEDFTDATYARIDGGEDAPGYFTITVIPYAIFDESTGTLTFYYGSNKPDDAVDIPNVDDNGSLTGFRGLNVTKVVFDESFANYRPKRCSFFSYYSDLTEIVNLKYLNTEDVEDMSYMFVGCYNLTTLDLSGFNTSKVANMSAMFSQCSKLETIYVGDGWTTKNVTNSDGMCYELGAIVGGEGTMYDRSHTDATYARIDVGDDAPGYFTRVGGTKPTCQSISIAKPPTKTEYAIGEALDLTGIEVVGNFSNGRAIPLASYSVSEFDSHQTGKHTLTVTAYEKETALEVTVVAKNAAYTYFDEEEGLFTFYYGAYKEGANICKGVDVPDDKKESITKVVFDKSFATYHPTSCQYWFSGCSNLTEIVDMDKYLNTDQCTDMRGMFNYCLSLASINLSHFNTENVTDMGEMFVRCPSLEILDLSSFDTKNVLTMRAMFAIGFWRGEIDAESKLKTIYVSDKWITATKNDRQLFLGCDQLVGGNGTRHADIGDVAGDMVYACIDDPENGKPGYFTRKNVILINDEKPNEIVAEFFDNGLEAVVEQTTQVNKVEVLREFEENSPSTIVLPIDMDVADAAQGVTNMNGYEFYEFAGVAKNSEGKWTATYNQVEKIEANKPYIIVNKGGNDLVFDGGEEKIDLKPVGDGETTITERTDGTSAEGWEFVGAYEKKVWETDSPNEFGFAAKDVEADGIKAGDFVRIGAGASLKPMRSYLRYTKDDDPFISKAGVALPHEIEVHLIPLSSVVKPEEPEEPADGDIKTPVSENVVDDGGVRVWSYDKTIVIAAKPGAEYQIFDANGRLLKSAVTQSDRDEVSLARTGSGIVVVRIGSKTFKVKY